MINDFNKANAVILDFWADYRQDLDNSQSEKLLSILSSPVMPKKVSEFAEFVYANSDRFTPAAKLVAADICNFATQNGFYGLAADQRGSKIAAVLSGEEVKDAPAVQASMTAATDLAVVEALG